MEDYVYRGLTTKDAEFLSAGIMAKDPLANVPPAAHIEDVVDGYSQWISTSKSVVTAEKYANTVEIGRAEASRTVIAIDLSKVQSNVQDFSRGGTGSATADKLAIADAEILVERYIPAEAIVGIMRNGVWEQPIQ